MKTRYELKARLDKKPTGTLTLVKMRKLWNSIENSRDIPTHYCDQTGLHKINAKPSNKTIKNKSL